MKKKKIIILSIMIIVVALLLEASILKYVNDKNAHRTSKVLLDRVITVLDKNDENRNELIESLKDDYIVRAKAVSYMIDADPAVEYDVNELQKIAKLMAVDEIHLFDDQGTIYSGSAPKYFGYNFDSGAQMEYFKPMLKDKSLTMCQDVYYICVDKCSSIAFGQDEDFIVVFDMQGKCFIWSHVDVAFGYDDTSGDFDIPAWAG